MKSILFKDAEVQAMFERDGYVVLDFISPEDAQKIANKFYALHKQIPAGFYSEAFNPDSITKEDVFKITDSILHQKIESVFQNYKKLGSTFLCKGSGEEGKVGVHQDWTVVDESKYCSITIWIPTIDTTFENGALRVLPGSHRFYDYYRSNNIPVAYGDQMDLIWESMITVPMKAGQAFVLNHAVIHASAPNKTSTERLVIAYGLTSKNADLVYYYQNTENKVEKYEMPDDFFQKYYNIGQRPLFGKLVDTFDYPVPKISKSDIEDKINKGKQRKHGGLLPYKEQEIYWVREQAKMQLILEALYKVWEDVKSLKKKYSIENILAEIKKG